MFDPPRGVLIKAQVVVASAKPPGSSEEDGKVEIFQGRNKRSVGLVSD